jgi:hypothetical protein
MHSVGYELGVQRDIEVFALAVCRTPESSSVRFLFGRVKIGAEIQFGETLRLMLFTHRNV